MCATQTKSDLPQYFYIPANTSTRNFYICLTPPKAIQHLVGKQKYRQSTGTADLRKARPIGARLIAEKLAEWDAIQSNAAVPGSAKVILSSDSIKNICARRLYQWMHVDDLGRYLGHGTTKQNMVKQESIWKVTDEAMRSILSQGRASPEWAEVVNVVDFWCNQIEIAVDHSDPLFPRLVREFAEVDLEGVKRLRARNAGEAVPTPPEPSAKTVRMSRMTEVYRDYLSPARQGKQLTTTVGLWSRFVAFMSDAPINDVQHSDVFNFLESRIHDKTKPWSMGYANGVVLRTLKAVFSLAISKGIRQGANPAEGLTALPLISDDAEKARLNPRRAYTDDELNKVYASDWYNPNSERWKGKMGTDLSARYWVPLICMFHGNRVREVLQLVASDFSVIDSVPVFGIQVEIDGEQHELAAAGITRMVKNESTKRKVPIHPTLLSLGILDFLQVRRDSDGTNALLFPSSIPKLGGKTPILGRAYEQAFLRFVRDALGLGKGLGNHGFRHQLEDRIRKAQRPGEQWPAGLGQQYAGRKSTRAKDKEHLPSEGSEQDYGDGYDPATILMYISHLNFSAIKLPAPYVAWMEMRAL